MNTAKAWREGRERSFNFGRRCPRVLKIITVQTLEGCPLNVCDSDTSKPRLPFSEGLLKKEVPVKQWVFVT